MDQVHRLVVKHTFLEFEGPISATAYQRRRSDSCVNEDQRRRTSFHTTRRQEDDTSNCDVDVRMPEMPLSDDGGLDDSEASNLDNLDSAIGVVAQESGLTTSIGSRRTSIGTSSGAPDDYYCESTEARRISFSSAVTDLDGDLDTLCQSPPIPFPQRLVASLSDCSGSCASEQLPLSPLQHQEKCQQPSRSEAPARPPGCLRLDQQPAPAAPRSCLARVTPAVPPGLHQLYPGPPYPGWVSNGSHLGCYSASPPPPRLPSAPMKASSPAAAKVEMPDWTDFPGPPLAPPKIQDEASRGAHAAWSPPPNPPRTTVMLRNLPEEYSREDLRNLFDETGFEDSYDFVYLPTNFRTQVSFGYAFVNMIYPADAERLHDYFQGFTRWGIRSPKICEASWSDMHQGLPAHIERYRNSPVMHESVPDEYKPAVYSEGRRVPFPPPTKKLRVPRVRRAQDSASTCTGDPEEQP